MDETKWLLQQYETVAGLYKHANEIRQSRINWGLALEAALLAAVGAFGEHLPVVVAASVAGMALALALFFIAGRHSAHTHLRGVQLRAIEKRLARLAHGEPVLTAFCAEKVLFEPPDLSLAWLCAWVKSVLPGRALRSFSLLDTREPAEIRFSSGMSANLVEEILMVFILLGWAILLGLFAAGLVEIGGDGRCVR